MSKETTEEAAERFVNSTRLRNPRSFFCEGAKWKEKRMYSEEECYSVLHNLMTDIKLQGLTINDDMDLKKWFEQFKKK